MRGTLSGKKNPVILIPEMSNQRSFLWRLGNWLCKKCTNYHKFSDPQIKTGGRGSCRTTRSLVLKESPLRFIGYSSFNHGKDLRNPNRFISEGHGDFIPLISNEDPDSPLNVSQLEENEDDSSESTGSNDSYHSCNTSIPTPKDKKVFFDIVKHLLEDQSKLQEGSKEELWCDNAKLKLTYMGRECKALILDGDRSKIWEGKVKTKTIYLKWRGDEVEPLSLENLQTVQNELKFLGIQNEQVHACFSFARTKFMEEPKKVQENTILKIICGEVILTFGKGKNLATVLYDDNEKIPRYDMKIADWCTRLRRNIRSCWAWIVTKWRGCCQCVPNIGSFLGWLFKWCIKIKRL